ncbi:MAG: energy-coupling factor ABC transporter ATP-binding protein [Firmicutes bacterium]|nr:energy-coupling factor ABC transporter ATP-binding protein [Bacillota bacterium]
MAAIEVKNLSFTYPTAERKALDDMSFAVEQSEFVVLCGKSGCGKSTLLRHLKKNLIPYGEVSGKVFYCGQDVTEIDDRINAAQIGFVQQNPDNQLVTDKVWHELAFGLESLGLDNQSIKRRVAEMASFFDIQTWFRKDVSELSGGQKQLLNLASVMVMQPKVLILDEPTSQLDPIAATEFLKTVYRINRELGTTVIISEHRLEELFTMADKVMVMDKGRIIACDEPWNIGRYLGGSDEESRHPMFYGMPAVMKIYSACRAAGVPGYMRKDREFSPLTIREGRLWLEQIAENHNIPEVDSSALNARAASDKIRQKPTKNDTDNEIINIKNLWFRYNKDSGDVLRGLNISVRRGELFCLLGGNGVGKSTTLKAISGNVTAQRGSITVDGLKVKKDNFKELFKNRLAMLPQNPQALFTEITVEEELMEALYFSNFSDEEKAERIEEMLDRMEISHLSKSHPYDLSGGEQQRLALGKILLLEPKILLLDEPTKGLDPFFKITLAGVLKKLTEEGVTIFMVSHDVEFCAEYADRCAMFFDGDIVSVGSPKEFFAGNNFYTTSANRIARKWLPEAVTWEEVAAWAEQVTMTDN